MATRPAHCTDAMWQFWLDFRALEPSCELGGIYAPKPGYHHYRNALPKADYSVQLALDKQGPGDMAAAIDLTFPDAQSGRYETIIKYSQRLLASGRDLNDPRGNYLREFYGQADADTQVEGWDFQYLVVVTSEPSHLWHIHLSFLRAYLNIPEAFRAVLSILRGETVAQWRGEGSVEQKDLIAQPVSWPGRTIGHHIADTDNWLSLQRLDPNSDEYKAMPRAVFPQPGSLAERQQKAVDLILAGTGPGLPATILAQLEALTAQVQKLSDHLGVK